MYRDILRDKNLSNYFLGRFVSNLGNSIAFFAQSILALLLTGGLTGVGALWIVRGISSFLLIPLGGVLADKYNRKHIILFSDIFSALLSFSFLLVNNDNFYWLLPILVFSMQAINRIFDPAAKASFRDVSNKTPLEISGSFSAILGQVSMLVGPLLASWMFFVNGNIYLLFVFDGLTFLFSFFLMLYVYFGEYEKKLIAKNSFYKDIKEGFLFIFRDKNLLFLILSMVPIAFSGKVFEVLILSLSEQKWGFGESAAIGIYLSVFAIGGILGSYLVKKWKGKLNKISMYFMFSFALGVLFILLGSIYNLVSSLIVTFGLGVFLNLSVVMVQINIQKNVESNYLGRVFSTWTFLAVIGGGVGAYISGVLSDLIGVNKALITLGLFISIPFLCYIFVLVIYNKLTKQKERQPNA